MKKQSSTEPVNIPLSNIDREHLQDACEAQNNENLKLAKNRQQVCIRWKSKKCRNETVQPTQAVCTRSITTCDSIIQPSRNSDNITTPMNHNKGKSFYDSSNF